MKNILITGGLGFIGFNAIQLWKKTCPEFNYFILDIETYAAQFCINEKKQWLVENNVGIFKCDICDEFSVEAIIKQYNIDTIVNFAAESHVDNSINGPDVFFTTNALGTTKLLNVVKKHNLRFHQISTDEVYGETNPGSWDLSKYDYGYSGVISAEEMPLKPSSPYSASKASADMLVLGYVRTYNVNATISRCTNNFGPWQHPEKLIGTVISKALKNECIPIYGAGNQRRHWIYVDEHNAAIMDILKNGKAGQIYNIAPPHKNWITNMRLAKMILKILDKPQTLLKHVTDRPGHDITYYLYGTDFCQKTRRIKDDLCQTVEWYKSKLV